MARMNQSEIARALGVGRSKITEWKKMGCPTDSVENVRAWLSTRKHPHLRRRAEKFLEAEKPGKPPMPSAEDPKTPEEVSRLAGDDRVDVAGLDLTSVKKMLENVRKLAAHAAKMAQRVKPGEGEDEARKWSAVHAQLCSRQLVLEREVRRIMREDRLLLDFAQARQMFGELLSEIRALVDAMPATMSGRVNPSDPELAMKLLTDWKDNQFLKVLSRIERT